MKLRPFDSSLVEDTSMYDKLPYIRDPYRCNADAITLISGNVLKFYRCKQGNKYELTDMDRLASEKIREYQKREAERLEQFSENDIDVIPAEQEHIEGLSENEIQELMDDKQDTDSYEEN